MMPYRRDIYWEEMKKIANKYKEIRINTAKARKEREKKEQKTKAETPIIKKPNIPINREKPKPITIEKVATKPIIISNTKCNPIIITKPNTEKEKSTPIIIQKKETIPIINQEKKSESIQIEEKPIVKQIIQEEAKQEPIPEPLPESIPELINEQIPEQNYEQLPKQIPEQIPEPIPEPIPKSIPETIISQKEETIPTVEVINIEKKTEFIQIEEKPIETNTVQEISHYKVFQENSISQEEFTKEATFVNSNKPDPNNPKQFKRWYELQLRKE
jgi:hypothetical protein